MPRNIGLRNFTEDLRCLILADYLDGMKCADIQAKHGVSYSYATMLAKRSGFNLRNRKHVKRDWLILSRGKRRK